MNSLKRLAAVLLVFAVVLGNTAVFTCGDTAKNVQEFTESFDINTGVYTETYANGRQFMSTVPEGAKTYDGVILNIPKDIYATLTCDGDAKGFKSGEPVYGKGYYVLTAATTDVVTGETVCGYFTFRIMGEPAKGVYNKQYDCQMLTCVNTVEDDSELGMYKYTFPNCKVFYSTVSEYGADVSSASFVLPKSLGYSLKRNGAQIGYVNNDVITAAGNYVMTVYAKNHGTTEEYSRVYKTDLSFSIEGETSSSEGAVSTISNAVQSGISDAKSSVSDAVSDLREEVEEEEDKPIDDMLSESYNEEANLYKQTFSNGEGFYTNIENGGMSGGNVYIDIPSNMTVEMTKDGIAENFENKKYMDTQGTYILNIISEDSEGKYKARFTFRIQKGVEASADASTDEAENEENAESEDKADETADGAGEGIAASSVENEFDEDKNMFVFHVGSANFYTNMPDGMFSNSPLKFDLDDGLDYYIMRGEEDYETDDEKIEESGSYTLYVSDKFGNSTQVSFDLYADPVNNFESFTAPRGYSITMLEYSDYKDNYGFDPDADDVRFYEEGEEEETEEEPEESFEEETLGEAGASDEEAEETTEAPPEEPDDEESEEDAAVADGAEIINMQIKRAASRGLKALVMPLDGRYTIQLSGSDNLPMLKTEITVDTIAPEVDFEGLKSNMKSSGNEVTISCSDEETTLYLYPKSGEESILGENGGSATIRGTGEYTLIAVDRAGNQSQYTFKITRHIGASGVGAIVLLFVIAAGIAAFMFYSSKKYSVR